MFPLYHHRFAWDSIRFDCTMKGGLSEAGLQLGLVAQSSYLTEAEITVLRSLEEREWKSWRGRIEMRKKNKEMQVKETLSIVLHNFTIKNLNHKLSKLLVSFFVTFAMRATEFTNNRKVNPWEFSNFLLLQECRW